MYFTFEMAERIKKTAVTINCVNPGHASTNIWPNDALYWKAARGVISMFADPPSYAAENVFYTASSDEMKGISGKYISNLLFEEPRKGAFEKSISRKLWEDTLEYLAELI
jgi:NAD(P)-dependent dehydrogenase (short-subunit alcohol dehydrogenase family)